jgi:hypothetical protein
MSCYYAEGTYVCRIKSQEMSTTKNGNLQLMIAFTVLGTPDPENPENYLKNVGENTRRVWLVFTEKTMEFCLEHLATLGWFGESLSELDPANAGFHSFRDRVADFYCKHEERNGIPSERWFVGRKPVKAARQEKVRELDALLLKHRKGAVA